MRPTLLPLRDEQGQNVVSSVRETIQPSTLRSSDCDRASCLMRRYPSRARKRRRPKSSNAETAAAADIQLASIALLLSPAKHSYNVFVVVQSRMSFSRACLARARNPESGARAGQKIGILRAAATRENDKRRIQQDQNRHYDMQDSIVE